jgi:hypothetical protein
MSTLMLTDLASSKELGRKEMVSLIGGSVFNNNQSNTANGEFSNITAPNTQVDASTKVSTNVNLSGLPGFGGQGGHSGYGGQPLGKMLQWQ